MDSGSLIENISDKNVNIDEYDIVFIAGGWGASYDLGYSIELGEKISAAYANDAIIGTVCHGALGLLNAVDKEGNSLLEGRNVTGVTNKQVQELKIEITPMHPETELRKAGAIFKSNTAARDMLATLVVVDGNVVTGQNQNSSLEVAQTIMNMLNKNK